MYGFISSMSAIQNHQPSLKQKGQRKTQDPCANCYLHKDRCICAFIPSLTFRTKLSLIIHSKELKRATNTGSLAAKALVNSEIHIRGRIDHPLSGADILDSNYQPLLFYPAAEAMDLTAEVVQGFNKPIQLIVPDGNWRQASKVNTRYPEFAPIPRVMIKAPNLSTQHLRTETTAEGMATLQAIAWAFGVLEGETAQSELLALYEKKLAATLLGRGQALV